MGSAKDEVRKILDRISDDSSFDDIQYTFTCARRLNVG